MHASKILNAMQKFTSFSNRQPGHLLLSSIFHGLIMLPVFFALWVPFSGCNSRPEKEADSTQLKGSISISGAFALYPLTVRWAEAFMEQHPGVRIDISAGGAGKGMADVLSGMVDLAMFSREVSPVETQRGAWKIAVARDAVFPTINVANPDFTRIQETGLTQHQFRSLFLGEVHHWGALLDNRSATPVHVFTRSDACGAAAMWAAYLGHEQEQLKGTGVFGDPGMADAVKNDPLGVGYNNLVYLYDLKTRKPVDGLYVLPLDLNNNGKLDPQEQFYESLDAVMKAIADGLYPAPPARKLYLISKGEPSSQVVRAFINYVLKEGQTIVPEAGYIQLH